MQVIRQIAWFIIVGCAAAATHWLVAVACVAWCSVPPFAANFIGWAVAVAVSFSGHYRLTFRHQQKSLFPAIRRFLVISASGFAVNETAFVSLLAVTDLPYDLLLAAILVAVAFLTFVFSRYWAFRDTR